MSNLYHCDYRFKVILVGDSTVGKTSLHSRYTINEFGRQFQSRVGVDFRNKLVTIEGKSVKAQIWDTAGQERFRHLYPAYYRGTDGVVVVYDITNYDSYINIVPWIQDVRAHAKPETVIILVGNKSDLNHLRQVTTDEAKSFAAEYGIAFYETSALDSRNVEAAFETILREIYYVIAGRHLLDASQRVQPSKVEYITVSALKSAFGSGTCY